MFLLFSNFCNILLHPCINHLLWDILEWLCHSAVDWSLTIVVGRCSKLLSHFLYDWNKPWQVYCVKCRCARYILHCELSWHAIVWCPCMLCQSDYRGYSTWQFVMSSSLYMCKPPPVRITRKYRVWKKILKAFTAAYLFIIIVFCSFTTDCFNFCLWLK